MPPSVRPAGNATVGIEPADKKQAVVVCDHESQVLAREAVKMSARQRSIRLNPRMSMPDRDTICPDSVD